MTSARTFIVGLLCTAGLALSQFAGAAAPAAGVAGTWEGSLVVRA